ncbi:hypothetical protein GOB94_12050 [Granulicella sp. 5B5]|nr:hypothetical protein GOB94_12050 [Granulicella sp. 5B5]
MTDTEIQRLLNLPKQISDPPSKNWRTEDLHRRKDFRLVSKDGDVRFRAFARQHVRFPENFSVGLEYEPDDGTDSVILIRCNGPHGDFNRAINPLHPHYHPHIHIATAEAIDAGQRAECHAEITTEFASIKEAIRYFLNAVAVDANDQSRYFSDDLRLTLFDMTEFNS